MLMHKKNQNLLSVLTRCSAIAEIPRCRVR